MRVDARLMRAQVNHREVGRGRIMEDPVWGCHCVREGARTKEGPAGLLRNFVSAVYVANEAKNFWITSNSAAVSS